MGVDEGMRSNLGRLLVSALWMFNVVLAAMVVLMLAGRGGPGLIGVGVWLGFVYLMATALSLALQDVTPVRVTPPVPRPLPHLSTPLARLVYEAGSIRAELGACDLDHAMQRAWELCCDFARVRATEVDLGRSRAALADVHALIDLRAQPRRRLAERLQRERLAEALHGFEMSLARPAAVGFR